MAEPIKHKFIFNDGTSHDATVSQTSESFEICFDYGWSLFSANTGLGNSSGSYTIEVSNDNATFYSYKSNAVGVGISDAYDDIHLSWTFMRIVYAANTETSGTVEFELTLKP